MRMRITQAHAHVTRIISVDFLIIILALMPRYNLINHLRWIKFELTKISTFFAFLRMRKLYYYARSLRLCLNNVIL